MLKFMPCLWIKRHAKPFFALMHSETPPNERKVINLRTRNGERGRGTDKTRPLELYGVYSFKPSLILNTNKNYFELTRGSSYRGLNE